MYITTVTNAARPHLCLVTPGSDCEASAQAEVPDQQVLSNASGLFLVTSTGYKHRIELDWGV